MPTANQLVFLEPSKTNPQPFTTSDIIAEYTKNSYRSIQRTIERQITRLEKFGQVRFEITSVRYKRGTNLKKVYQLNEEQATLLISFLKNTDTVADFKVELVRQFYEMRRLLLERQSVQWQQVRNEGKAVRRLETDAIKMFVEYAEANGSKHSDRYYMLFTTMAYRALGIEKGKRNILPASVLLNLRTVEQVIDRAIWEELAAGTEYHQAFQRVKSKVEQLTALVFSPLPSLTRLTHKKKM